MYRYFKNSKGLTLIEIIVTLAILGIIVTPLASYFTNSVKMNIDARNRMNANYLAQQYMEEIRNEISSSNVFELGDRTEINDSGFTIKAKVEPYRATEYSDESNNNSPSDIEYDAVLILKDDRNVYLYRGESEVLESTFSIITDNTIKIKVENDNMNFANFSSTRDIVQNTIDPNINIKFLSKGDSDINLEVSNLNTDKSIQIFIIRSKSVENKVNVITTTGIVKSFNNIYDSSEGSHNTNRVYKITVSVEKDSEVLAKITGLKSIY